MRIAAGLVAALALGAGGAAARQSPPSYALPSWSPDGQRLAFASASGAGSAVVTADAGGGPLRRLSRTGALSQVVWSPRGGRIAYGSRGLLYVIRSDGKQRHGVGSGAEAAWSPDGTRLAFVSSAVGGPIELVDAGGGVRTRLTSGRSTTRRPGRRTAAGSPSPAPRRSAARRPSSSSARTAPACARSGRRVRRRRGRRMDGRSRSGSGTPRASCSASSASPRTGDDVDEDVRCVQSRAALVAGWNEAADHGLRALRHVPARRGRSRRQRGDSTRTRERSGLVA